MISKLGIRSFKSILGLSLDCSRVNILIGEPNVGKSNILEAIGLFSLTAGYRLQDFVRINTVVDLFHNGDVEQPAKVFFDDRRVHIRFENGAVHIESRGVNPNHARSGLGEYASFGLMAQEVLRTTLKSEVRFYRFRSQDKFPKMDAEYLLPPYGENLVAILQVNKKLRKWFSELLNAYGLNLNIKPQEARVEILKESDGGFVTLPFLSLAETLQRLLYYRAAMLTNKNCTLLFEEPEAHLFPHYAKYLAERMAVYEKENQYFVSTHNPYFLQNVLAKTPISELAVFAVSYGNGQTSVSKLTRKDLSRAMDPDADIFFNLDRFTKA